MQTSSGHDPLRVIMFGPDEASVGGMYAVAAAILDHCQTHDDLAVELQSSGGGVGLRGYHQFVPALGRVIRGDHDVVHLHVATRGSVIRKALLAELSRMRGTPYIVHVHGADFADYLQQASPRLHRVIARFFNHSAGVIALGEHWRDVLVDELQMSPELIVVINNGVPQIARVSEEERSKRPSIVFLGEFGQRKGGDIMLGAAEQLLSRDEFLDWHLDIVGTTIDKALVAASQRLNQKLQGRVHVHGPMHGQPKRDLVGAASIFCLPSRAEGLPMALLEAMSSGIAPVSTTVGSIPEVLDGTNGIVVPPGDVDALVAALSGLMSDEERRRTMGDAAEATWREKFTQEAMVERIIELWHKAGSAK